jgi:hypothetical protein
MTRRPLALLLVLSALLLVAGCGDDDDDGGGEGSTTPTATQTSTTANRAYQQQVQTILATVGTAGSDLGSSVSSNSSGDQVADALEKFQSRVEGAADKLDDLDAPSAAAEGQDELEQVLREIADDVQESIDAAREGDRAKFASEFRAYQAKLTGEFRQRLTAAGAKIDQALKSP